MNQNVLWRVLLTASLSALLAGATSAVAQVGTHEDNVKLDVGSYPVDIQHGYKLFASKCSECHSLTPSLKQSRSAEGWAQEVRRMQAMASSHINDREAHLITNFLVYVDVHRSAAAGDTAGGGAGGSPEQAGKQTFDSYGCSSCHSVGGAGNTSAPLDGIGSKETADALKKLITSPPSESSMPAMDVPAKDLNNLVAYLLSLK